MKREYDFSRAERGKFYQRDADLVPPVHLEPKILAWLTSHAQSKGVTLDTLVNELLEKEIERIEAAE
jgi:hypothetical protein